MKRGKIAAIILLSVFGIGLCVANVCCAFIFSDSKNANVFAAISGWVSGLATLGIGLIAYWQNKSYKVENDRFLQKQSEENKLFIDEQKDLAWRNLQYQFFSSYLGSLKNYKDSIFYNNFTKIYNDFIAMPIAAESLAKIIYERNNLSGDLYAFMKFLISSEYFVIGKNLIYEFASDYRQAAKEFFNFINDNNYKKCKDVFNSGNKPKNNCNYVKKYWRCQKKPMTAKLLLARR